MDYTRWLPDSPQVLTRWELIIWLVAGLFGVVAIGLGFVAREVARHRGTIVQARFDDAIRQRDEKLTSSDKEISRLRADSGKTAEQTVSLSRRVEEESERRVAAERALRELQLRDAPRRLSAEQRATIVAALRRVPQGQAHVVRLGDAEAGRFANDLILALQEAGWTVEVSQVGTMSPPVYGVTYFVGPAGITQTSEALLGALKAVDISVALENQRGALNRGLLVGLKQVPAGPAGR